MGNAVTGSGGIVQIGATGSQVEVKKVKKWTYKSEYSVETTGPYINDPNEEEILGGKKCSMDFECVVPEGGDAGQNAAEVAHENKTRPQLVFTTELGKVVTFATPLYKSYEIETDAKGTQTQKFTISGVASVAQDT